MQIFFLRTHIVSNRSHSFFGVNMDPQRHLVSHQDYGSITPAKAPPSKVVLFFINLTGLGFLGLDRIYMGCRRTGTYKFVVIILAFLLLLLYPIGGIVLLGVSFLWNFHDTVVISMNMLARSRHRVFCEDADPQPGWVSESDIDAGFYLGIILVLVLLWNVTMLILSILVATGSVGSSTIDVLNSIGLGWVLPSSQIPKAEAAIANLEHLGTTVAEKLKGLQR